jgi:hypothetical protein
MRNNDALVKYVSMQQANPSIGLHCLRRYSSIFRLAAGVWSMRTRFVDLKFLLYDFIGVLVVGGGILTALGVFVTLIGSRLYGKVESS